MCLWTTRCTDSIVQTRDTERLVIVTAVLQYGAGSTYPLSLGQLSSKCLFYRCCPRRFDSIPLFSSFTVHIISHSRRSLLYTTRSLPRLISKSGQTTDKILVGRANPDRGMSHFSPSLRLPANTRRPLAWHVLDTNKRRHTCPLLPASSSFLRKNTQLWLARLLYSLSSVTSLEIFQSTPSTPTVYTTRSFRIPGSCFTSTTPQKQQLRNAPTQIIKRSFTRTRALKRYVVSNSVASETLTEHGCSCWRHPIKASAK